MRLGRTFKALSTAKNPSQWLVEAFGGKPSKTGVNVTIESSLGLAPVVYAVNKISGHVAQLPVNVRKMLADGGYENQYNNIYRLLNKKPNDIMTAYQMKEIMMVHALMAGNGRAYIERNSNGTPVGLIPIMPYNCQTMLVDGQKWHLVTPEAGTTQDRLPIALKNGQFYKIPDRDMLHVMNTSYNGVWGLHVIDIARDVFGLTQAGQEGAAVSIANNSKPSMLLEAPQGMFRSAKDAKEFLDAFNAKHEGLDNSGKAGLLRDGMSATVLPMTSADSQFLQQRNFQREEIALLFGLESILGDNVGSQYKSVSERNTAYVDNCLNRWFAKWQQEIDCKLLPYGNLESKFDTSELMNGDPNAIADYTNKLSVQGTNTINELRMLHGFGPIEGGDEIAYANRGAGQEATPDGENGSDNNEPETNEEEDNTDEA